MGGMVRGQIVIHREIMMYRENNNMGGGQIIIMYSENNNAQGK